MKNKFLTPAIIILTCPVIYADNSLQIEAVPLPPETIGVGYPAINQSRQVALSYFDSTVDPGTNNPASIAYLWSNGNLTALPLAAGLTTGGALGISSSGTVVGYVTDVSGGNHPAIWSGGALTVLDQGAFPQGCTFSVNGNGQIAGQINTSSPDSIVSDAAVWNGTSLSDLGNFGSSQATAIAINSSGQAVIDAFDPITGTTSFIVDNHGVTRPVTIAGSNTASARSINDLGQVIVTGQNDANYIWQDGKTTLLCELPNTIAGFLWAINNQGDVVGFTLTNDYLNDATLWHNDIPYDLNTLIDPGSGWDLQIATGITDDGAIVGIGTFDGQTEAFLLTPTGDGFAPSSAPEPATLSLLALAALPLLLRRFRRFRR